MPLILSIDTSLEEASICIAEGDETIDIKKNVRQMDHAAWIQTAIGDMLRRAGRTMSDLSAVAVTAGPGSYTGLRVGLATAKGICYSLGIPLITESALYLLAQRVKKEMDANRVYGSPVLICPMIDARRMEVFTTLYDFDLNEIKAAGAIILDQDSFRDELSQNVVLFCGNGIKKWQNLCLTTNAVFVEVFPNVSDLAEQALKKFNKGAFSDLAYTEPTYLKAVYTGTPK